MNYNAIDLFSGCGGLSEGMRQAGFLTRVAVELVPVAVKVYQMNHPETKVIDKDIREIDASDILKELNGEPLHLLAGCPPCQGFSSIRRLNRTESIDDDRNNLVLEFLRMVKELKPLTIMMENVPALKDYSLFKKVKQELKEMGYNPKVHVINVKDYGVPQSRRRLIMVGSILGDIDIAESINKKVTVRETIGKMEKPEESNDLLHRIIANHTPHVLEMIRLTPHNGGSRKDLPQKYVLSCHQKQNIGFNDVYGRLRWDDYSTTITGGCLNPSKGRFLHPEQDRVITPREAAMLQSFPQDYKLPFDIPKAALALLIGNALPPRFSFIQSENIRLHIEKYNSLN
ncbi:MAG: DNA cytosine methyltransferase [Bacteroidia bacterium]|nr:DNA cytosine methyltransferase [Bacteroidia bacterium]